MPVSLIAVVVCLASLLVPLLMLSVPAVARQVLPGTGGRIPGLDGLRGILALSVVAHHIASFRVLCRTGRWGEPGGGIANLMGQGAVAVFFMVSAYLFVGKIIRSEGRLALGRFFLGRLTRLTPVYVVMTGLALLVVLRFSSFPPQSALWAEIVKNPGWVGFGFFRRGDINGVNFSGVMISPVWSLRYEWLLYALLPFLAVLLRVGMAPFFIAIGFFFLGLLDSWFAYFGFGTAAAILSCRGIKISPAFGVPVLLTCLMILGFKSQHATEVHTMLLTFIIFYICINDRVISRLLDRQVFFYSGQISYSIYLTHMPLLFFMFLAVVGVDRVARMGDGEFTLLGIGMALPVVALATLIHIFVEKPGMEMGIRTGMSNKTTKGSIEPSAAP